MGYGGIATGLDPRERGETDAWTKLWQGVDRALQFPTGPPSLGLEGKSIQYRLDHMQESSLGFFPASSMQRIGNAILTGDFSKVTAEDWFLTALALLPGVPLIRGGGRVLGRGGIALEAFMRSYRLPFFRPAATIARSRVWIRVATASPQVGAAIARAWTIKRLIYTFGPVVGPMISRRVLARYKTAGELLAFEYVLSKFWFTIISPSSTRAVLGAFFSREDVRATLLAPFSWAADPRNVFDFAVQVLWDSGAPTSAGIPKPMYDLFRDMIRREIPRTWGEFRGDVPAPESDIPSGEVGTPAVPTTKQRFRALARGEKAARRSKHKKGSTAYKAVAKRAREAYLGTLGPGRKGRPSSTASTRGRISSPQSPTYADTSGPRRDRWFEGAYSEGMGYNG